MTTREATSQPEVLSTSQARWAASEARRAEDRSTRRVATITVVMLGIGLALWLTILLLGA